MKGVARLTPLALAMALAACSTTQNQTQDSGSIQEIQAEVAATTESEPQAAQSAPEPTTQVTDDRAAEIASLNQKISALESTIADNNQQIQDLNAQLNAREAKIAELESTPKTSSTSLTELEQTKAQKDQLEANFLRLKTENDQLRRQVNELDVQLALAQAENTQLKEDLKRASIIEPQAVAEQTSAQPTEPANTQPQVDEALALEFEQLNKDYRTLDSKHYALSQEYRDLQLSHAQLRADYNRLKQSHGDLSSQLSAIKQENLKLGGALSDARAQHQVLWDKIRLQRDVIDDLEARNAELGKEKVVYVNASATPEGEGTSAGDNALADKNAELEAQITRLRSELVAQNKLLSDYQEQIVRLEAELDSGPHVERQLVVSEQQYQTLLSQHEALTQRINELEQALANEKAKVVELETALQNSRLSQQRLQAELQELKDKRAAEIDSRRSLEAQVNNLIPFEGAVLSLTQQLNTGLDNVRWQLPTTANINDVFEVLVTADVNNALPGQRFYAELLTDSALSLMSSAEADAQVDNGKVTFRWRVSGLNEQPNAQLNLIVHQSMNYSDTRFNRLVYRDDVTVDLKNQDWFGKYWPWGAAILAGLFGGFLVGRSNKRS